MEVILSLSAGTYETEPIFCFNPCFDGSHSLAAAGNCVELVWASFNPCFDGSHSLANMMPFWKNGIKKVSILVLMEVILSPIEFSSGSGTNWSFNPCFDGSHSLAALASAAHRATRCFNPCFDGSHSLACVGKPCAEEIW